MSYKKTGAVVLVVLAVLGAVGFWAYKNRKMFYPKVEEVKYLKIDLESDTAKVTAGLQVQNFLPLPIHIDSVHYQIRNDGTRLGWGGQLVEQTLPIFGDKVLDFVLFLKVDQYREHLKELQKTKDSLDLEASIDVYFNLPFIKKKSITINRKITTAIPKAPGLQLDTVLVKSFSPEEGYSLLLRLKGINASLPNLRIEDFKYQIKIDDLTTINGKIDTVFRLRKGETQLEVPVNIATSEALSLLKKQLTGTSKWQYQAQLSAKISSDHRLLDATEVTLIKDGSFTTGKMANGQKYMPSVKRIKRLQIESDEKQTQLLADLVIHNPSPIPFYIDSATYYIRYKGKRVASGRKNFEKVLPKQGDQTLALRLTVNEKAFNKVLEQAQGQDKVPLEVELNLLYNLPDAPRQKISIKRKVEVPVPAGAGLQVAGLEVRELSASKGAHLLLKLKAGSPTMPAVEIKQLDYQLQIGDDITIKGSTSEPIKVQPGDAIAEIPLKLSTDDVLLLVRKLLKGQEGWDYQFSGTATVTASGTPLRNTQISLQSQGELQLPKGSGTSNLMPHVSEIDSMKVVIHYDTAWVRLHLKVKNPLPVPVDIDSLKLFLIHERDTFGIIREKVQQEIPAEGMATRWVTMAVNYDMWHHHVRHHQHQDSLELTQAVVLVFQLGSLPAQRVPFSKELKIGMPRTPVAELKKTKFRGIGLRQGIKLKAIVQVQNANVKDLTVKNIYYDIQLQKTIDFCGTINRTYTIPEGTSTVELPFSLSVGEVLRVASKKLFGSKEWTYKIYMTAMVHTASPLLQNVHLVLESIGKVTMTKGGSSSEASKSTSAQQ